MAVRAMFPLWLRVWHWLNAALFLALAASGFSLHLAGAGAPPLAFRPAVVLHNTAAALILASYAFYLAMLGRTGDWRQYVPRLRGVRGRLAAQVRYYLVGIFQGEEHLFTAAPDRRFNPLQQITYLLYMFVFFPLLAATGVFLLFPGAAPERVADMGGVWPMAVAHTLLAFAFLVFLIVHVYLALTASESHAGLGAMLHGGCVSVPAARPALAAQAPASQGEVDGKNDTDARPGVIPAPVAEASDTLAPEPPGGDGARHPGRAGVAGDGRADAARAGVVHRGPERASHL
ncbi:MAG: cytochrome b/b6 domain-containing protein [Armatimonadetes bacterium]|nr:cytochrome b/b6 domain-containing protein [Armatimonadota bacterium]